jgi:hypothetical protein
VIEPKSITYSSLAEILTVIRRTHPYVDSKTGAYVLKLWRQTDGTRIMLEALRGIRLSEFVIQNNTVIIEQYFTGTSFKAKALDGFRATFYLPELYMVNVYDCFVEFCSKIGMDFSFSMATKDNDTLMLAKFIHKKPPILQAQWFQDAETESLLATLGTDPRSFEPVINYRNIEIVSELD